LRDALLAGVEQAVPIGRSRDVSQEVELGKRYVRWLQDAVAHPGGREGELLVAQAQVLGVVGPFDEMISHLHTVFQNHAAQRDALRSASSLLMFSFSCVRATDADAEQALQRLGQELALQLPMSTSDFCAAVNAVPDTHSAVLLALTRRGYRDADAGAPSSPLKLVVLKTTNVHQGIAEGVARFWDAQGERQVPDRSTEYLPLNELYGQLDQRFLLVALLGTQPPAHQ
jgi:hypothetical protein